MAPKKKAAAKETQPSSEEAKSETAESPVTSTDMEREEPYRIDKGESLPPFRNPNLNPDRAK